MYEKTRASSLDDVLVEELTLLMSGVGESSWVEDHIRLVMSLLRMSAYMTSTR